MEKIKEYIENNKLNCEIIELYEGHEATKGCKRNKNNFNFIFDRRLNDERQNLNFYEYSLSLKILINN